MFLIKYLYISKSASCASFVDETNHFNSMGLVVIQKLHRNDTVVLEFCEILSF